MVPANRPRSRRDRAHGQRQCQVSARCGGMAGCGFAAFRAATGASLRHQDARARSRAVARLDALLAWARPSEWWRLGIDGQPLPLTHRLQQLLGRYAERIADRAVVVRETAQTLEQRFPRGNEGAVDAKEDDVGPYLRVLPLARLRHPRAAEGAQSRPDEVGHVDPAHRAFPAARTQLETVLHEGQRLAQALHGREIES